MKQILFSLFIVFMISSCGENTSTPKADSNSLKTIVKVDSVIADTTPKIQFAKLLGGDTIIPKDKSTILFSFDQKLVSAKWQSLSFKQVRKRFMPIDSSCDDQAARVLKRFFELNTPGIEPNLSDGKPIYVVIRLIDTINVSPSFTTVTWEMNYRTEYACPFSEGTYYMVSTYDKASKLISTQKLGQYVSGGDAPMFFSTTENGNIFNDGSFKSLSIDTTGEESNNGKPTREITKLVYYGSISADGHILKSEPQ